MLKEKYMLLDHFLLSFLLDFIAPIHHCVFASQSIIFTLFGFFPNQLQPPRERLVHLF